jgi:hypothetical protein
MKALGLAHKEMTREGGIRSEQTGSLDYAT